jgi:hypothetical protein
LPDGSMNLIEPDGMFAVRQNIQNGIAYSSGWLAIHEDLALQFHTRANYSD